jgi:hypothetical protein
MAAGAPLYNATSRVELRAHGARIGQVATTGSVRSKNPTAQVNEVLCKALCFNLSMLVHAIHELGIEPSFPGLAVAS